MLKRSQVKRKVGRVPPTSPSVNQSCQSITTHNDSTLKPGYALNIYQDSSELTIVVPDRSHENGIRYRRVKSEYSCFVRIEDLSSDVHRMLKSHREVIGVNIEGKWVRIRWSKWETCKQYCQAFHDKGIQTYEGKVSPILRYMVDNDIRPARPRIVYIDIETDSRVPFSKKEEMRILSWVTVDENDQVEKGLLRSDTDKSEYELLSEMWKVLDHYDLVIAWNGDRFDFPVMQARSIKVGINNDPDWQWKRWLWLDHLEIFRRMNTMVAESGEEKQSFALENIAQAILGEGKDDFDSSKTWESWIVGGKERKRLLKYNVKDTRLLKMIEDKTGYIELLLTLGDACGTFSNTRGANPTVQVESFFQRLASTIDYKFPTVLKYGKEKGDQYKGAFVMEPTGVGIVKNVHVADFSSLYPTIIKTWNMSPETITNPDGVAKSALTYSPLTDVYFTNIDQGILPRAIEELLRLRKEWNKKKSQATPGTDEWKDADRRSTAYKIAANSFYGVIGTPVSRFFDRNVAESVTQCGAWLIKKTIEAAEDRGMNVIYGDTDSVFVSNATRTEFEDFVEWCNIDLYPTILQEVGCKENAINLAYEKEFERIVFTAAKKYAGRYAHYKGTKATTDSKPEIKGLEYKRGDSIRLARDLQSQVVDMLVGSKNGGIEDPDLYQDLLDKWMNRVIYDPVDLEDIVISKRLSKNVDQYNRKLKKDGSYARQLPHIEMARLLHKRGRDVSEGAKIDYVIVDGSVSPKLVIPAEDWTGESNRFPIWDSLVYPPTCRLLTAAFPHIKWSEWSKSQKVLDMPVDGSRSP